MRSYIALFVVLFLAWYSFSGFSDMFFLACGAVSCAFAVYITYRMNIILQQESSLLYLKPFSLSFWVWLAWLFKEIVLSSINVSRYVWKKELTISPVLAWIESEQKTSVGVTTYANGITLTPGTVCIDTIDTGEKKKMLIHALVKENLADLENATMDKKISRMIEVK